MPMTRSGWIVVAISGTLLLAEAVLPYDNLSRRVALMLTNVAGTAGLLWYLRTSGHWPHSGALVSIFVLLGIWLDALGNFYGWYVGYQWWDRITHFVGTAAVAVVASWLWAERLRQLSGRMMAWLGLLTAQAIAASYEISEYLGDLVFATHRVGPGLDTSRDLWFNFLGGVLGTGLWYIQWRVAARRRKMV